VTDRLIQMVDLSTIIVPSSARTLDQQHAHRLAQSLGPDGELFQAIGLIADGEKLRIVWGRHRYEAYRLLMRKKIPARVLPPDTKPEAELKYSLLENDLRRKEDPEDVIARVEKCASRLGTTSLTQAAEFVGINKSTLSRLRTLVQRIETDVRLLAKEHKVGNSILYTIATHATDSDDQRKLLKAHLEGATREQLIAGAKSRRSPGSPKLRLHFVIEGAKVTLEVPKGSTYEAMLELLRQARSRMTTLQRRKIPLHLLPALLSQSPN